MSHLYIYSPSGAVRDKAAFKRGVKRLQALGHEVEIDADALSTSTRFAGDDDTRLAAISRAAASGADLALISRGGYGLTRLLDRLPYKAIAKAIEKQGTRFVGISDFTAFQNALLAKRAPRLGLAPPCALISAANTSPTTSCSRVLTICSQAKGRALDGRCQSTRPWKNLFI